MKISMNKILLGSILASSTLVSSVYAQDETFEASIKLVEAIAVTEVAALRFPEQIAGTAAAVVVAPADSGAAQFNSTGDASRNIVASVVETSIEMVTGDGVGSAKRITVDNFTTGGAVAADGSGAFDGTGALNNIRVGGTANMEADDIAGDYVGTATFRLVYA